MKNEKTAKKTKSTILMLLAIFFLFNAALMFRAGVNTIYFVEDTSVDYAPVQVIVKELKADDTIRPDENPRIIPVFSFIYQEKEMSLEAPILAFARTQGKQPFQQGEKMTLWVHKYRGELILPPRSSQKEIGRSQMVISAICLLLAIMIWVLRDRMNAKGKGVKS